MKIKFPPLKNVGWTVETDDEDFRKCFGPSCVRITAEYRPPHGETLFHAHVMPSYAAPDHAAAVVEQITRDLCREIGRRALGL